MRRYLERFAAARVSWPPPAECDKTHLEKLLFATRRGRPAGRINQLEFLSEDEARFLSQIQVRAYANIFGLVECFINCKILELSKFHRTGDQVALEALVRFSNEELKHQELFRRIERMVASKMPPGYNLLPEPNAVAAAVLSKSYGPCWD